LATVGRKLTILDKAQTLRHLFRGRPNGRLMKSGVTKEPCRPLATESNEWSQRVGGFTAVPALIRQLGVDPASILAEVGLSPDAIAELLAAGAAVA